MGHLANVLDKINAQNFKLGSMKNEIKIENNWHNWIIIIQSTDALDTICVIGLDHYYVFNGQFQKIMQQCMCAKIDKNNIFLICF